MLGSSVALASLLILALSAPAGASLAWGSINNFDTVNDTGSECHGFEIEIDGIRSSDITYTYDWNHYGTPKITQDNTDPLNPKVFVRYQSGKNPDGTWAAYTAIPSAPIPPTLGHQFTDPSVNFGGEHFGVGFFGTPAAVMYNWLKDDGTGNLTYAGVVNISTPTFSYNPPAGAAAAQVQAEIVPPPRPDRPRLRFGPASWVMETRTSAHNNHKVELRDLVSPDPNDPNFKNWKNGEPDEVEVEWQTLQTDTKARNGDVHGKIVGAPEDLKHGDEVITRRYDFFKYVGPIDAETGEAMATAVGAADPDGVHYFGTGIVTYNDHIDPLTGEWVTVTVDLSTVWVVADYIGAQMAGFDAAAQLGLIDHLQDGEVDVAYPDRTLVIGGSAPIVTTTTGSLPAGMTFDVVTGVLSGTPTASGVFTFTLHSTDAAGADVTKTINLCIADAGAVLPPHFTVSTSVAPAHSGSIVGDAEYLNGDTVTVVATANPGYVFVNWTECGAVVSQSPSYQFTVNVNRALVANFAPSSSVTVTTSALPVAGGSASGSGTFNIGDSVSVVATANPGYSFVNWTEGGVVVSALASYTFTVNASRTLVANFASVRPSALGLKAAKGAVGTKVTLTTSLQDKATRAGLSGRGVQFSLNGVNIGPVVMTNALGSATCAFVVPEETPLGLNAISATFAGDAVYAPSTAVSTLAVSKGVVKLTIANVTGHAGSSVNLSAKLTNASNVPMVGETLVFTVDATAVGSAVTDANGVATLTYSIPAGTVKGNHATVVTFNADADHSSATKGGRLLVK